MKTIIATLAAAVALSAVAVAPASAQPGYHHGHGGWNHHRPHKVCFIRHHRRVCTWR